MAHIRELKKNLKQLSEKIVSTKRELKEHQKANSGYDGGYFATLHKLSWEFRHKHIAYCLLRGTIYECIEVPAEDNKPDMEYIKGVQDEYTKDVCTCPVGSL